MKNRKKFISLLAAIMAGVLVFGLIMSIVPAAGAEQSSSEIRDQINALEDEKEELEGQMAELKGQYEENENEIVNIVSQKNVIDQEIGLLMAQINLVNEQIAAYNVLIADKQDELDAAIAQLDALTEQNRERIRAMEEEGSLSYWAVLFEANSFTDLLDRLNMVEEIAASDHRRLEEMNAAAEAVAQAQAELTAEKDALEDTMEELDALYNELDDKREEADKLIQELIDRGEELEALYGDLEALEGELDAEIAQMEKEYNDAKDREWQEYMATYTTAPPPTTAPPATESGSNNNHTGNNDSTEGTQGTESTEGSGNTGNNGNDGASSGATWLKPCSYRKLTSPYGYREAPTAGASTFHQGVDLAGPEGTPIYASRGGKVTAARYSNSSGYYVTINHGDGFSSSYLHMTHYVVSRGQTVSAGQLIGYMGNTGISTGSHLHFAIYYNGSSVNPAQYVRLG